MACDTDSGERIAGESAARGTAAAARLATYLHMDIIMTSHDISQIKRIVQNYEDMGGCILWEYGDTKIDPITDCSASILFGNSLKLSFRILKFFSIK